jgi:hypothetical protein
MDYCALLSKKGKFQNTENIGVYDMNCMLNNKITSAKSTYPLIMSQNKKDFIELVKTHILAEKEKTLFIYNKILAPGAVQILIFKKNNKSKVLKWSFLQNKRTSKNKLLYSILQYKINGFKNIKGYVFNRYIYGNRYSKNIGNIIKDIPREDIESIYDKIYSSPLKKEFEDFYKKMIDEVNKLNKTVFKTNEYKTFAKNIDVYPFIFNINRLISEDIKYYTPTVKKEILKFRNQHLER